MKKILQKLKLLSVLYAINDVSTWLLKKETDHTREQKARLRKALIFVIFLLAISIIINIYLYIKYV